MIPSAENSDYPKFVADQVLTADNLNDLFGYLDEQGRMTRTNLVGMGIVCGLRVITAADGSSITITKGVGITSHGYLVTVPEIVYTKRTTAVFDAVKCTYYNRFVDTVTKTQKFDLWELKQDAESEGTTALASGFLNEGNKIVLIFVELLEENNKNCDPDSCDDKGTRVTVNFRPLLASRADVDTYLANNSNTSLPGSAVLLPDKKMPRFDVPATLLLDTEDVFDAYLKILTQSFIDSVQSVLSLAYARLKTLVIDDFPTDPFNPSDPNRTLHSRFAFLYNNTISDPEALHLQYFYDFFSDLLLAYDELRKKTFDTVCECIPDEDLFPRHLLLGEAIGFDEMRSDYRTRFISSPALCCCGNDASVIRRLFRRIVLMTENFLIPVSGGKKQVDIRITPSLLGREPLSEKAIPFYYEVNKDMNDGKETLYLTWNPSRTERSTANQILSYHANAYNTTDDFVVRPLKYDLEPNNFLRIEGHIGRDYRLVLADIEAKKRSNRLPFDVVALSSDTRQIFEIIAAIHSMDTSGSMAAGFAEMIKHPCCFADIFLAFDEWINKMRCCLAEQMRFYLDLPAFEDKLNAPKDRIIRSKVFGDDKSYVIRDNTIAHSYQVKKETGILNNQFCSNVFINIATNKAEPGSALLLMPYRIDKMGELLPDHITQLDVQQLEAKYAEISGTAMQMRDLYSSKNVADTMGKIDISRLHAKLEVNCLTCLFSELRLLIREFLMRLLGLMIKQKLGYYSYINPGIQHKAGVPMGGTFILVYHEQSERRQVDTNPDGQFRLSSFGKVNTKAGDAASSFFSGNQALLSSILLLEELAFLQQVNAVNETPNQVLDPIVANMKPGTVIADFYVPYLCCSDCPPASFILMGGKPDQITVAPGAPDCTADGSSYKITLTISGGAPPYKVDGTDISGNSITLDIKSGEGKTVEIEDKDGLKYSYTVAPHTCQQKITVQVSAPKCEGDNKTFSVLLTISGGTGAYRINGQSITGNTHTVITPSGGGQTVIVEDISGNQESVKINDHTCCDLPCGGKAERCKYVLWLQKPDKGSPTGHFTEKAEITFTDEKNNETKIDLLGAFAGMLDGDDKITDSSFDFFFKKLFEMVDGHVPDKFKSKDQPMFSYDETNQLLNIETFTCQNVVMDLVISISKLDLTMHVVYSKDGVKISYKGFNKATQVPKFGCVNLNKCLNTSEEVCKGKIAIKNITFKREAGGQTYSFNATPSFDAYYWYFVDGRPNSSSEEKPVNITLPRQKPTLVRLVAIKDGCFATLERLITPT